MENDRQKEIRKLIADFVHEAETLEEWKEKVKFASGFD